MSLPVAFTAALAARGIAGDLWIEIEGLPLAFGLTARAAAWFSGRAVAERRTACRGTMVGPPGGVDQEAQPLEGSSTVGQLTASLLLDADTRALIAGTGRTDGLIAMRAPAAWVAATVYALGDIIRPVRTDAAGSASWFRCTTAGTSGAAEPSWAATGTTADGAGTLVWTRMGPRDLALSTTDPIVFTGSASGFAAAGVLYLGRETIAYTSIVAAPNGGGYFSGITRGMYPLSGRTATQEHTEADLLSPYVRFAATRAAALYVTLDGTDAGKVARWAGTLQDAKTGGSGTLLDLTMESINAEFRPTILGGQRRGQIRDALADTGSSVILNADSIAGEWTHGEVMVLRINDEWVVGTVVIADAQTSLTLTSRAVLSSVAGYHDVGSEIKEVIVPIAYNATGAPEARASRFTRGGHPFDLLLQFLMSRKGDGANGVYDVLPEAWCAAGIDASRVDVAGILAVKRAWFPGSLNHLPIEEPISFADLAAEIMKPEGCYLVVTLGDIVTARRLSVPIVSATIREIGASEIIKAPSWDGRLGTVIGRVQWRCDYDPIVDDFRQTYRGEMNGPGTEAQEFYAGRWEPWTVEAKGHFTGLDPAAGYYGSALATGAADAALRYFEMIRDRYARPQPVISIVCSYSTLDVEVGDLVRLTVEHVPDVATGGSGLSLAICEVISKQVDDEAGTVELKVAQIPTSPVFRLVSPSGIVSAWTVGTLTITLADGEFNDADQNRSDGFRAGQEIRVYSADMATLRATVTIASVTATTLVVDAAVTGCVAGDVVILSSYDDQSATEKTIHASLADATSTLGAAADAAHGYAT